MSEMESSEPRAPTVSVLLPVYNCEKYVAIAIESILSQTFGDFELIVIDDCSSDASWDIVQKYAKRDGRIVALRNERNLKLCNTLNRALPLVKGRYVARADSDDRFYPDRLAKQVGFLDAHPRVGIVGGSMELMDEGGDAFGKREYGLSDREIRKTMFRCSPFSHPLIMMRKSILDKAGGYDPSYSPAEDYELYFRIGMHSEFANLPDVLMQYRIVAGSMTANLTRKMELATIRVRDLYGDNGSYAMTWIDRFYNAAHYLSVFIVPSKIKIRVFNFFRDTRIDR